MYIGTEKKTIRKTYIIYKFESAGRFYEIVIDVDMVSKIKDKIYRGCKVDAIELIALVGDCGLVEAKIIADLLEDSIVIDNTSDKEPLPFTKIIEAKRYIRDGKKLMAVKIIKEYTGLGLRECKNMVDKYSAEVDIEDKY